MTRRLLRLLPVALLLGTAALAAPVSHPASRPARAEITASGGRLALANSRGGGAILTAAALRPGDTATGDVRVSNTGTLAGQMRLSKDSLVDVLGPGRGRLSDALVLAVTDTRSGQSVYRGRLGAMGLVALDSLGPGEARTYAFAARLPDGGTPSSGTSGDNAFNGASVSVRFNWTAEAAGTPPALKLSLRARPVRLRAGAPATVRVSLVCSRDCRARVAGRFLSITRRIAAGKPLVRIPGRSVPVAGGRRKTITLRLKPAVVRRVLAALRHGRRAVLRLTVTATSSAGRAAASRTVTLRAR